MKAPSPSAEAGLLSPPGPEDRQPGRTATGGRLRAALLAASLVAVASSVGHPLDTWHTRQEASGTGYLQAVCHGADRFVAVGNSGKILTSTTGTGWSQQSSGTPDGLEDVCFGAGRFVAVSDKGRILVSSDGTNWTSTLPAGSQPLYSVRFGRGTFLAVGVNLALTSADGTNWTRQAIPFGFSARSLTFARDHFVMAAGPGTNLFSTDATHWTERPSGSDSWYAIGGGDGTFVEIDTHNHVLTSADGTDWVPRASVAVVRACAIAYGNGCFVTGGSGGMEYSSDAGSWTLRAASWLPRDICFGNGTFVAVGFADVIVQSDPVIHLRMEGPDSLMISGPVGQACLVQSSNPLTPGAGWRDAASIALMTDPQPWSDPEASPGVARWYRVVAVTPP